LLCTEGRAVGVTAGGGFGRIDRETGAIFNICDLPNWLFRHGSWGSRDVILLGQGDGTEIVRVPASGGEPQVLLVRDRAHNEDRVHWPWFLPDGDRFLYTARLADGEGELRLGQLDGSSRPIMRLSSNAQWVAPDIVVFARDGALLGQRVDLNAARPLGGVFSIAQHVEYYPTTSRAMFSTSRDGAIAYHPGGELKQLVWSDRSGREVATLGAPADYYDTSGQLSSDDTSLLVARRRPDLGTQDIWRLDLTRGNEEQITSGRGSELAPIWMPGGRGLLFSSDSGGHVPHLFYKDLATGAEEALLPPGVQQHPMGVFPETGAIVYVQANSTPSGFGMFVLPRNPPGSPAVLRSSPLSVPAVRLRPDGQAMAYIALVSGARDQILVAKGVTGPPRWSRDGREVYFVDGDDTIKSVTVRTARKLEVGNAQPLFAVKRRTFLLDVARDGRLLLLVPRVLIANSPVVVSTNPLASARP
jgi:Tol biopolymer transport system component